MKLPPSLCWHPREGQPEQNAEQILGHKGVSHAVGVRRTCPMGEVGGEHNPREGAFAFHEGH